jgi:hypothetical protein
MSNPQIADMFSSMQSLANLSSLRYTQLYVHAAQCDSNDVSLTETWMFGLTSVPMQQMTIKTTEL